MEQDITLTFLGHRKLQEVTLSITTFFYYEIIITIITRLLLLALVIFLIARAPLRMVDCNGAGEIRFCQLRLTGFILVPNCHIRHQLDSATGSHHG